MKHSLAGRTQRVGRYRRGVWKRGTLMPQGAQGELPALHALPLAHINLQKAEERASRDVAATGNPWQHNLQKMGVCTRMWLHQAISSRRLHAGWKRL